MAGMIQVTLESRNTSSNTNQFEVFDRVCDINRGIFSLRGGQSTGLSICSDDSAFGSVQIRNPDLNNDWVGIEWIRAGDTISR